MATRREVIGTLGAGSLFALPAIAAAAPRSTPSLAAARRVLVDRRFPESQAFARPLAARGVPLAAFNGDLTELWLHDLGPLWARGPEPIAGMTGPDALFVLEQLARGAGLRVAARSEPAPHGSRAVAWLIAPIRPA